MAERTSIKHFQIDKVQSASLIVIVTATVITIFSLFAVRSLLSQGGFQKKVINEKRQTVKQLKDNISAASDLVTRFQVFASGNPNLLGGDPSGSGVLDGNNARIVLDALPSKYDFPALTSSIEKIMEGRGIAIRNIGGTDEELNNQPEASPDPRPVVMNFSAEGLTTYANAKNLIIDFERSIRPFDVTNLELNGGAANLRITVTASTYYQPSKSLDVGSKEVR